MLIEYWKNISCIANIIFFKRLNYKRADVVEARWRRDEGGAASRVRIQLVHEPNLG